MFTLECDKCHTEMVDADNKRRIFLHENYGTIEAMEASGWTKSIFPDGREMHICAKCSEKIKADK